MDVSNPVAVIKFAWSILETVDAAGGDDPFLKILGSVNVDRECIMTLEEWMFISECVEAGKAGNQQWGLDAGDHQSNWDPYNDTPNYMIKQTRSDPEEERVVGDIIGLAKMVLKNMTSEDPTISTIYRFYAI